MTFEFLGGDVALDFANTVHSHGAADPQDDLKSFADFTEWCRQAGLMGAEEARRALHETGSRQAAHALRHALELRELIYAMFYTSLHNSSPAPQTVAAFNSSLRASVAQAQICRSGRRYRLVYDSDNPLERALGEVTRAAATLLTSHSSARVRQCAGDSCTWLFMDTSRNGLRRWCDMQSCGNRAKVKRFRRRASTRNRAG